MPHSEDPLPVENFEPLFTQSLGSDAKVKQVKWKHLTEPGENFGSLILAVDVSFIRNGNEEILNLVIKLPPKSDYLLDLFNAPLTFKKELHFYKLVLPAFEELQLEAGIQKQDLINIAPRYYGGRLGLKDENKFDEQSAIMLENLTVSSFKTQDRIKGLDKNHVVFAVKELAKLHAVAIALKLKKPEFFKNVVIPTLIPPANETAIKCVMDMVNKALNDLRNLKEAQPYLGRIEKTVEFALQAMKNKTPADEPWATFVHNDFWVNNMMFRYDDSSNVIDMKMVDFQLTIYDYGINDLIFFLISSANKNVIDESLDEMINLYYNTFIRWLKLLKVDTDRFSRDDFDKHLNYCGAMKFEQCIMMVQVIQATRGSAKRSEDGTQDASFLNFTASNEYNEKMMQILRTFERKGWFLE